MLTSCSHCTQDTGGNHEIKCPNYLPNYIIPNDSEVIITINPTITITFPISNAIIEFLEKAALEYCAQRVVQSCNYVCDHENYCISCTAIDLLKQIKDT